MNIYESVTQRILAQLEAGVVPWHKSWTTGLPKSLTTGREYRGINLLVLASSDYTSRYWTTYREAQRLGGHV
jgi:antirestriction protein ArdC